MLPLIDLVAIATSPRAAIDARAARRERARRRISASSSARTAFPALTASSSRQVVRPQRRASLPAALEDDADRRLPRRDVRDRRSRVPARESAAARTPERAESRLRGRRHATAAHGVAREHLTAPGDAARPSCRSLRCSASLGASRVAVTSGRLDPRRRRRRRAGHARGADPSAVHRLAAPARGADPRHPLRPDPALLAARQPAVRARAVPRLRGSCCSSAGAPRCSSIRASRFRRTGFEGPLLLIVGAARRARSSRTRTASRSSRPTSTRS